MNKSRTIFSLALLLFVVLLASAQDTAANKTVDVRIVGSRLITETVEDWKFKPFHNDAGLSFAMVYDIPEGDMPFEITDSKVLMAFDNKGKNLLLKNTFGDQMALISEKEHKCMFGASLALPKKDATSILEMRGSFGLRFSTGTKTLTSAAFAPTKDTVLSFSEKPELSLKVNKVGKAQWGGGHEIEFSGTFNYKDIKTISLANGNGTAFESSRAMSSQMGTLGTISLSFKSKVPKMFVVKIELYEGLRDETYFWSFKNIDFLGKPIK